MWQQYAMAGDSWRMMKVIPFTGFHSPLSVEAGETSLGHYHLVVHLNPCFDCQKSFPFSQGEKFMIHIHFIETGFVINLCDSSTINFPNLLGATKYTFFSFSEYFHIVSIEVK
uniref:Galectin domain-containing protein n=1 Tax=Fundulus heteroclitus TaxID=8078 RepID=A0A3Q2UGY4_FUNHE